MSERSRLAGAAVVVGSARRNVDAARWFFRRALSALKVTPSEVVTDAAAVYPAVLDELIPSAGTTLSSTPKSDRG